MRRVWFGALLGLAACSGSAGPTGPTGADGADGANGADGGDGIDGADGVDGGDGVDGADGDDGAPGEDGAARTLVFEEVGFPDTADSQHAVVASRGAWVDGAWVELDGYKTILRTGQSVGGGTFGQLVDQAGAPILAEDGSPISTPDVDSTTLHPVGAELFAVSHLETNPGSMYLTTLAQDAATGELSATDTAPVDFSAWGGLWTPCAGSATPWGSHLGGEEYPPNARALGEAATIDDVDSFLLAMGPYFGLDISTDTDGDGVIDLTLDAFRAAVDPYRYGFVNEVEVAAGGVATATKHYAMGRVSVELGLVMPDERTVYITEDGTNVGLYLFVADVARDLSAGQLYAAKWYQTGTAAGGSADLGWVPLGHATHDEVAAILDAGVTFDQLFDAVPVETTCDDDGTGTIPTACCPDGFVGVNTDSGAECLQLRPGMELAASRLETRRYAAYLGATLEFRKMEGSVRDPLTNTLYVAMSAVERGMEDFGKAGAASDAYDKLSQNDIRLPFNKCGTVYALDLAHDATLGSDYIAENMVGAVSGVAYSTVPDEFLGNTCSISGIANPDNLTFVDGYATLIIGEDATTEHQNDAVWAYDLPTGRLDRILTTPYGAETTNPRWIPNVGGFAYLLTNVQHPYGESDQDKLSEVDPTAADAYLGYVGPFPAMD